MGTIQKMLAHKARTWDGAKKTVPEHNMREFYEEHYPKKNVYVVNEHQNAYYCWKKSLKERETKKEALLVHIDQHHDFCLDKNETLQNDNFIWLGIKENIIGNCILCAPQTKDLDRRSDQATLEDHKYCKFRSVDDFRYALNHLKEGNEDYVILKEFNNSTNIIIDVDLDYFMYESFDKNQPTGQTLYPKNKKDIDCIFNTLNDDLMGKARLTTIAREPFYCNRDNNSNYILDLFKKRFESYFK